MAVLGEGATAAVAERHGLSVPPDRAHLPERYGVFTLIMFGEAVVAILRGMAAQDTWTLGAAAAAFASFCVVFAWGSWYFDGACRAAFRTLETRRDLRLMHVWTGAHVPLGLGLAMAGVGLEHAIHVADHGRLASGPAAGLAVAVALVMAALATISAASAVGRQLRPRIWKPAGSACLALGLGVIAPGVAPALAVVAWAALGASQIAVEPGEKGGICRVTVGEFSET